MIVRAWRLTSSDAQIHQELSALLALHTFDSKGMAGILRREKSFCKIFREVFRSFCEVFQSFRKFFEVFASFSRLSDPFGPIGMHSEAIGSVWTLSKNFDSFWIFDSFFNVSGRHFYKKLFHDTIKRRQKKASTTSGLST